MSLINQMLRDLEHRRGATPDTSGLLSAPAVRSARQRRFWFVLLGLAVLTGVGALVVERMASEQLGISPSVATSAQPDVSEAATSVTVAPDDVIAEPAVDAAAAEPTNPPELAVALEPAPEVATAPLEVAATGAATGADAADTALPVPTVEAPASVPTAAATASVPPVAAPVPAPTAQASAPAPRDAPPPTADGELRRTLVAETPRQRADAAYSAAVVALSEGRTGVAERRFLEALGHDASHHEARLALTNLLASSGRVRDAEAQLQEGLRLAPHRWQLADRYARLLFERGDLAAAIGILTGAAPEVGEAPDYHALLAALLQRGGHHEEAADRYRSLVDLRPDEGLWWMGLGISLEHSAREDAALLAYSRAVSDPRLTSDIARFVRERIAALDPGQAP